MTWLPVFKKSLVLSCVKQSSVLSHFASVVVGDRPSDGDEL